MSRRTAIYRGYTRADATTTAAAILANHRKAIGKKSGKVCSLPMKAETASRIATAMHAK